MTDPITAAAIAGLALSKFAAGAEGKAAEKLVERLWEAIGFAKLRRIAARFKGRKKAQEAIA